jgi:AcrR family transcriptional regulator
MEFTNKQQEIIDLSIQLIADLGIQGFTIKNLSKRVGVTEGAIYRHFESKTEILYSILKAFQAESAITLDLACNSEKPVMEEIEKIFSHHFKYFSERPAIAAVIFSESIFQNDNLLSKEVFKLLTMHEDALVCIITRGQLSGEIRNGDISKDQLVRIIIGSIRYTVTKWRLSNYKFDIKAEGQILLKNIKALLEK